MIKETRKILKLSNRQKRVAIPRKIMDFLELEDDSYLDFIIEGDKVIIQKGNPNEGVNKDNYEIMKEYVRNKRYTILNERMWDEHILNTREIAIFTVLLRWYDERVGYSYPTYEELKTGSCIHSNITIKKALKGLEEKGYIKQEKLFGSYNKYCILKKEWLYSE